jgi:Ca2+-binding EF-hand superfamily protein
MKITFNDFKNVLQGQHILFNESEYENLFEQFSKDDYLQFTLFIREFKKQLNETKLNYVENAFSILDSLNNGNVTVNLIKMNYDVKNHPDVISGRKNEEEKLLEFIDCFEINNEILNNNNNNYIDFEIFANFYEYVAFVYENDNEFGNIINATFHE